MNLRAPLPVEVRAHFEKLYGPTFSPRGVPGRVSGFPARQHLTAHHPERSDPSITLEAASLTGPLCSGEARSGFGCLQNGQISLRADIGVWFA
jgi:hypothetical protein